MTNYKLDPLWMDTFGFPEHLIMVDGKTELRNELKVKIIRFQKNAPAEIGQPHISFTFTEQEGELQSYVNTLMTVPERIINEEIAFAKANEVMRRLNPYYFRGLSFIMVEKPLRSFINESDEQVQEEIFLIKYSHRNGTYAELGMTTDGLIVGYEINIYRSKTDGSRATEMWDNDDWVENNVGEFLS